jgi:hypothetical protein
MLVAHTCNLIYMRLGGSQFKTSLGKKFTRPLSEPTAGNGGVYLSSQLHEMLRCEDHGSKPALVTKILRPHLNAKQLVMALHACHSSYSRKHKVGGSWFRPAGQKQVGGSWFRPALQKQDPISNQS